MKRTTITMMIVWVMLSSWACVRATTVWLDLLAPATVKATTSNSKSCVAPRQRPLRVSRPLRRRVRFSGNNRHRARERGAGGVGSRRPRTVSGAKPSTVTLRTAPGMPE